MKFDVRSQIIAALQALADNGGTIHWRGIYSPLGCEQELFRRGYAERSPIIIPGMDKKGARITEAGLEFLKRASEVKVAS